MQFLAGQIDIANDRISQLETSNRAYAMLFRMLISIAQHQDGKTQDVMLRLLDYWRDMPDDGSSESVTQKVAEIQKVAEDIIVSAKADGPTFTVIDGGKDS